MATSQQTVDHLIDQVSALDQPTAKKMFGEYCLYLAGKPVALVCNDQLFVKPTNAGAALLGKPVEQAPYPGAKAHYLVSTDRWDDREWICRLLSATAGELPTPKPKKKR